MKKASIKGLSVLLCIFILMSLFAGSVNAAEVKPVKNVIFLIGDGMGVNQINMARASKGSALYMDEILTPYTIGTNNYTGGTTDSAAAATALATGVKTRNGYVGLDYNGNEVDSLVDVAKGLYKKAGLITTTTITYATPAPFAAHVNSRSKETEIAVQMINHDVDVLMGGGSGFFNYIYKDRNGNDAKLVDIARNDKGYDTITTLSELQNIDSEKLLGLFDAGHMPIEYYRDKTKVPSISEMTAKGIEVLNKDKNGFFLMVEGGQIDTVCHSNQKSRAIEETLAFDQAVKVALDFAKQDKNTLVVVTGDHETGGLKTTDVNNVSAYSFSTGDHTNARVNLCVYGPSSENFNKDMENIEIQHIIKNAMQSSAAHTLLSTKSTSSIKLNHINNLISGINPKTSAAALKNELNDVNGIINIVDASNNPITDGYIGTGAKIRVTDSSGQIFDELTVVIYGDVNGDSNINSSDLLVIKKHILGMGSLSVAAYNAANCNKSSDNNVNSSDLLTAKKHILGVSTIAQ